MAETVRAWCRGGRGVLLGVALAASLLFPGDAFASAWMNPQKPTDVACDDLGVCYVIFANSLAQPPSCSSNHQVVAFDGTSPGGQLMLKVALSAYLAGKRLKVYYSTLACLELNDGLTNQYATGYLFRIMD